jgi:hypothetical protein
MEEEPKDLVLFEKNKLQPNEKVSYFIAVYMGEMFSFKSKGPDRLISGQLILTNQRVVFYHKQESIFFGNEEQIKSIALEKIDSLNTGKTGSISIMQYIEIVTAGTTYTFKRGAVKDTQEFFDALVLEVEAAKKAQAGKETVSEKVSLSGELSKLADMMKDGTLTKEEFDKAKAKLLG